jgi:hypothetical protein
MRKNDPYKGYDDWYYGIIACRVNLNDLGLTENNYASFAIQADDRKKKKKKQ